MVTQVKYKNRIDVDTIEDYEIEFFHREDVQKALSRNDVNEFIDILSDYSAEFGLEVYSNIIKIMFEMGINIFDYINCIPSWCFYNTDICQIKIGDNITSIRDWTFLETKELEKVIIPGNIKVIGFQSFEQSGVVDVVLEEGVEEIYGFAFQDSDIMEITLPKSLWFIDKTIFNGTLINTINVYEGSYAEKRCKELDWKYNII